MDFHNWRKIEEDIIHEITVVRNLFVTILSNDIKEKLSANIDEDKIEVSPGFSRKRVIFRPKSELEYDEAKEYFQKVFDEVNHERFIKLVANNVCNRIRK